jgi:hypothetical protein
MRVNEIITESLDEQVLDEFSHMDKQIYDALKAKGYKYLGSGVDQTAFTEPGTGFVLKIFGTGETDEFSEDHKMFFRWYKFCTKHQSNPFLPRFYGHESFFWPSRNDPKKKDRYLMIRTEPLQDSGNFGKVLSNMAQEVIDGESVKTVLRWLRETNPNTHASLINHIGEKGITQFLTTAKKLEAIGDRAGYAWDLHWGNIMVRPDGTPIINDPWVS